MLAWRRSPYTIVVMPTMMTRMLFTLIRPANAVNRQGHRAVTTLACVLVISQALQHSGVVDLVAIERATPAHNILIHINTSTALALNSMAPDIAMTLAANLDPSLFALIISVSSANFIHIDCQSNTRALGPGGMHSQITGTGLPVDILIVLICAPLLLYFWPMS